MIFATAFDNDCRHEGGQLLALLPPGPVILVANAVEALEELGGVVNRALCKLRAELFPVEKPRTFNAL